MIARPARVRIRSRKPWVLDRRRLFGWNVRLLTRNSYGYDDRRCSTHREAGCGGWGRGAPSTSTGPRPAPIGTTTPGGHPPGRAAEETPETPGRPTTRAPFSSVKKYSQA